MSQTQKIHNDSAQVALHVASGVSDPVSVNVPRSQLERPFRELVRDAIQRELSTDPAAHDVDAMLGRPGVVVESGNRYLNPDVRARDVLEASDQDQAQTRTVRRLLKPQSGGGIR